MTIFNEKKERLFRTKNNLPLLMRFFKKNNNKPTAYFFPCPVLTLEIITQSVLTSFIFAICFPNRPFFYLLLVFNDLLLYFISPALFNNTFFSKHSKYYWKYNGYKNSELFFGIRIRNSNVSTCAGGIL